MKSVARWGGLCSAMIAGVADGEARFPALERAVEGFDRAKLSAHPRRVGTLAAAQSERGRPHGAIPLWESRTAADLSGRRDGDGGRRVGVRLDDASDIRLRLPDDATVLVDGKEQKVERDPAAHPASLSLDAGTHILRVR